MDWKALARIGASSTPILGAVIAATQVVEVLASGKGKSKEDQAVALIPVVLPSLDLAGVKLDAPEVEEAVRKTMRAYVDMRNAEVSFEEARHALEQIVTKVKKNK